MFGRKCISALMESQVMTNIAERLLALQTEGMLPVIAEAADELKRLTAERNLWKERTEQGSLIIEGNVAEIKRLELLAVNRLIEIDRLTALVQSNDDITWELTGDNERLRAEHKSLGAHLAHLGDNNDKLRAKIDRLQRWIYATARSLEKSSLSLEEYNAITAEVCHTLEPKP